VVPQPASVSGPPAVGTLVIVAHTHLPWLAHHGTWPVGEEWLHQAWASCYLPLVEMLHRLAGEGHRDLLSLGVTPVLAAQLDDPYCLAEQHGWLGRWRLRAEELAGHRDPHLRDVASLEFRAATEAIEMFETRWRHGGSAALRPLVDGEVVELLGGPATHPILPLLPPDVARFALRTGLDDARLRLGHRPAGLWAPECAYAPGLEDLLGTVGVGHLMLEGPTVQAGGGTLDRPWRIGDSDLVTVGRHLRLTDRVWSSRSGYPGGADYRDFHHVDASGFRPFRVTDTGSADKAPYDPAAAAARARADAVDFVTAVRSELRAVGGLAVVAWDTELFGHWWHEGVLFLEHVLRMLPEAGVRVRSLARAIEESATPDRVRLPAGTWGAGKDFRLWSGPAVQDLAGSVQDTARQLSAVVRRHGCAGRRSAALDQLAREALLGAASDWPFMVSRDSAARYGRDRAAGHLDGFSRLAALVDRHGPNDQGVSDLAQLLRADDDPFGALDARLLPGQA
jgi:1,4-alpha-glucan branching enzyme